MRFLLLCPAALLLLATPAITTKAEIAGSMDYPALPENPGIQTVSPEKALPTALPTGSSEEERLKAELANAREMLIILENDKKKLEAKLKSENSKLRQNKIAADRELEETKIKLQETQDKLDAEMSREEKCQPNESEIAKLVAEETSKKLVKQERELKRIYREKYASVLRELKQRITREIERARGPFEKLYKPSRKLKPNPYPYPYYPN